MTFENSCIFNRNSKCIFKGGPCDRDCDKGNWEGTQRAHEDLLQECLEGRNGKLAFTRKAANLLLQFT